MPTKSSNKNFASKSTGPHSRLGTTLSAVAGPSTLPPQNPRPIPTAPGAEALDRKQAPAEFLGQSMPGNAAKVSEYSEGHPEKGQVTRLPSPGIGASTVTEPIGSVKLGTGVPAIGLNSGNQPLDRSRVDSTRRGLTTNQGLPVADNQNSLKAGVRGPTLLEDFILREKITHSTTNESPYGWSTPEVQPRTASLSAPPPRRASPKLHRLRQSVNGPRSSLAFQLWQVSAARRTPPAM